MQRLPDMGGLRGLRRLRVFDRGVVEVNLFRGKPIMLTFLLCFP